MKRTDEPAPFAADTSSALYTTTLEAFLIDRRDREHYYGIMLAQATDRSPSHNDTPDECNSPGCRQVNFLMNQRVGTPSLTPHLFNVNPAGEFELHSGEKSYWKLDCDALTVSDWNTLAYMILKRVKPFTHVYGIPTGGVPLQAALRAYQVQGTTPRVLIVDDVLTSGESMERTREDVYEDLMFKDTEIIGAVVFARGPVPDWITPLFALWEGD